MTNEEVLSFLLLLLVFLYSINFLLPKIYKERSINAGIQFVLLIVMLVLLSFRPAESAASLPVITFVADGQKRELVSYNHIDDAYTLVFDNATAYASDSAISLVHLFCTDVKPYVVPAQILEGHRSNGRGFILFVP